MSRVQPYLFGLLAFASLVGFSQDESGLPEEWIENPEKMIFEAMAFDADIAVKRYISRHPSAYKDALEEYADKELPPLSQVRLVEIAYFVLDDDAFFREADEALEILRQGDTEHPSTAHLIQSVEKLVSAKTLSLAGEVVADRSNENLEKRDGQGERGNIQAEETNLELSEPLSSSRSLIWPYVLVAVALVGIVGVLVCSRKGNPDR